MIWRGGPVSLDLPSRPRNGTKEKQVPVRLQFRRDATGKVTFGEAPPAPHNLSVVYRPLRVLSLCADSERYFPRVSGVEMSGQGSSGPMRTRNWV